MNAVGIVCEYNPFHKGHKYQIDEAKKLSGCQAAVCVMSGSMVQRGEVALLNKWERARTALENGADLVIELPAYYVLQSADQFAFGALEALTKSNLVSAISFGSESADAKGIKNCAKILADESSELKSAICKFTEEGFSYPFAMQKAMDTIFPEYSSFLQNPNDMLGVCYVSSMLKMGKNLDVFPVKRLGADHNSNEASGSFASSSYIRKVLSENGDISAFVPYEKIGETYSLKSIESFILGVFLTASAKKLSNVPGIEEGFENRLITCAKKAKNLDEFFSLCTSKRYTLSRVKRTVLSCIMGMEKGMECDYIRVLGMNDKGAALLKQAKDSTELPFVTKTADFKASEKSTFKYDILATDIASLACNSDNGKIQGKDFYTSPIKI